MPFPRLRHAARRHALAVLAAAVIAIAGAAPVAAQANPDHQGRQETSRLDPSRFRGVNWADPRDNFADDAAVPSGLSTADNYRETYRKTVQVVNGFRHNLGANTLRLPVNPYSVGPNSTWWSSYRATVDAATQHGFTVILSYWEGTNRDGYVDDPAAWWSMWSTLTTTYRHNPRVIFEPMNEPHGYTPQQWETLAADWLHQFSSIPRDRVMISGSGYNDDVTTVCHDPALDGTYVTLHHYGFWGDHDYAGWRADFVRRIGDCAGRTVVDEFGSPMTTGLDYSDATSTDNFVLYLRADTDAIRDLRLGAVYWPGLRSGDTYSMETVTTRGRHLVLTDTNPSGVARLQWAWRLR